MRKYKVRIPKDIKIASFYNSQILDEYYPSISCVISRYYEIGSYGIRCIVSFIMWKKVEKKELYKGIRYY